MTARPSSMDAEAAYLCAVGVVARAVGLPVSEVMAARRRGGRDWSRFWREGEGRADARHLPLRGLTVYLAIMVFDVRQAELALVLHVRRQAINKVVVAIEARRDLAAFDAYLSRLEAQLPQVARRAA